MCFSCKELESSSQMSWLKAASTSGDDVFDENADEMSVMSKEWVSNMKKRVRVNNVLALFVVLLVMSVGLVFKVV